ncbi:MAG TPA: FemAB family XrtA/PEP-CTERM system-associated protein [Candidatus Polarisedimenticolia bacterium]|nr:FemAB family XrtA/PEP-CTERM system-associated protein [Candidatus Polarisedimenticolia bacterium]
MPRDEGTTGSTSEARGPLRVQENPNPESWEAYVTAHPDASIFHGLTWQRVLERTFRRYRPCHRIAWRGDRVCGVLPLYKVPSLPLGCALVSTPLGVIGGAVADDEEAATALIEDATAHARRIGAGYVELRHERPHAGLPTKDLYVYFTKPIQREHEANLMAIPGKQRRGIRIAEKAGLTTRSGGPELLDAFYGVYTLNMRNLGSPPFPRKLFHALFEEYGDQARIFGAFQGEAMTSGAFTFFYRDRIMPYYASATPQGMVASTNEAMYWSIMRYGAEHGFTTFDFGRSKKDSGSYHFKRHWGFNPMPLPYQYQLVGKQEMPNLSPANPKFSMIIETWRRLPVGFTRWLGPKLSVFFP